MIHDLVQAQAKYERDEMPSVCLVLDDCLGDKTTALNNISSRYRHSNIQLLIISTQLFRKTSPTIRANANWVLIGKLTNESELEKISEDGRVGENKLFYLTTTYESIQNSLHVSSQRPT